MNYTELAQGLEEYLNNLKKMPKDEAQKKARQNLIEAGIIDENGNFIKRYCGYIG